MATQSAQFTQRHRPIRFGLSLPNRAVLFGIPVGMLLETAEQAEASGLFDSVWVGDNFLSKPRLEAIVMLSALAARTQRLRLGTICLASFPMRHPLPLAIQWASLDVLSGGRTILTVCNGGAASLGPLFATELAAMGIASRDRMARVEEGIELLRLFFGPDPVTYSGRFYSFDNVEVYPKPVQAHVPICLAVNPEKNVDPAVEERILRRVARLADGWQTDAIEPDVFQERWARIQAYSAEYGRAGQVADAQLHLMVNINDDAAQAYRESVAFLDRYYGQGTVGNAFLANWLAYGPASAVIEKINTFVEAGYTTIVLRFTSPLQQAQLERCVTEVLPAFQGMIAARAERANPEE
jgi:alkanesulfonate monooxygenase SsuD/methylene tetrahydromethanopterin reductase-like flavin-dependent oxidoreductase (luciferase family)